MRSFVTNLYNLLNDADESIPLLEGKGYRCLKDHGLRLEKNGNAGGGSWDGFYRSILLNTGRSDNVTMGFFLVPGAVVYLACSFDDNINNHNALQLNLNNWLQITKNKAEVWHDGTITVGKYGRAKNADIVAFVKETYPELIVNGKIFLGELDNSEAFSYSNENVKLFISNLIKYVLCREAFRVEFKKKKALTD